MATAISVDNFKTALGEVIDAITNDDYAAATKWYAKAEAQLAGLIQSGGMDGANLSRRANLDSLKRAIDDAASQGSGPWEVTSRGVI